MVPTSPVHKNSLLPGHCFFSLHSCGKNVFYRCFCSVCELSKKNSSKLKNNIFWSPVSQIQLVFEISFKIIGWFMNTCWVIKFTGKKKKKCIYDWTSELSQFFFKSQKAACISKIVNLIWHHHNCMYLWISMLISVLASDKICSTALVRCCSQPKWSLCSVHIQLNWIDFPSFIHAATN